MNSLENGTPNVLGTPDECAEQILTRVGKKIVLGLPLGLGKANSIANALYVRAAEDPSIELEIFTALTLARPIASSDLERRFIDPLFQRLAGNYPELAYNEPLQNGSLPKNISVREFYFPAGRRLNADVAQQSYTSTNYTHAARDLLDRRINVIAQLVARHSPDEEKYLSLSCNADLTLDLVPTMKERQKSGEGIVIAGQINDQLPFLSGPALVDRSMFDLVLDSQSHQFDLFQVPKEPVYLEDYAVALHVASLTKDGGTIQLGIGGFSDAYSHIMKLRHLDNGRFRKLLRRIGSTEHQESIGGVGIFNDGLYGCSEMLVEGLLELKRIGILKRRADSNARENSNPKAPIIHSSFFLGSNSLYDQLRNLDEEDLQDIEMKSVSFVNHLYGEEDNKRADRKHARFINKAMMVTALGAVVSDGLQDGQIVSGVGGQYNFVAQAHELSGGRSIIILNAVRYAKGRAASNIVWNYGHITIPRHLRDIVVTEYGVADLRGKSDEEVVIEMLRISDSRFQENLLRTAKRAGKVRVNFTIPDAFRSNYPERIVNALREAHFEGLLPNFPLGTEFVSTEIALLGAFRHLKSIAHSKPRMLHNMLRGWFGRSPNQHEMASLERLGLQSPKQLSEHLARLTVLGAMRKADHI